MEETQKIAFLGLSNQDTTIITSMFQLWSTVSPLNYQIIEPASCHDATLVFLDADNPQVAQEWQRLRRENTCITPVVVGNPGSLQDCITLPRPLIMQQVQEVLLKVIGSSQPLRQKMAFGVKVDKA